MLGHPVSFSNQTTGRGFPECGHLPKGVPAPLAFQSSLIEGRRKNRKSQINPFPRFESTATRRFWFNNLRLRSVKTKSVWERVACGRPPREKLNRSGNFSSQWKCHIKRLSIPLSFRVGSPGNGFPSQRSTNKT